MPDSQIPQLNFTPDSETNGGVPHGSESFGTVPHPSESFRSVPNVSASFRNVPNVSERTADHVLTVREVARMFEDAGVSRTERSIVKWCLPNKHDVARLDAVFDANERKWFITQESVERAIAEEQARDARRNEPLPTSTEQEQPAVPNAPESRAQRDSMDEPDPEHNARLRDLEITNRVKDAYIDKLKEDLKNADEERKIYIQQLIDNSHLIGSLETQLRQIGAPREKAALPKTSDNA